MKNPRRISVSSEEDRNPLEVVEVERPTKVLRVATYARVSSPKQKTVAEQTKLCRERAAERGWKVHYVIEDHGLQGDDLERPGFQRLMDLAERHAIDVVVCWKIDRLARSLSHAVALEELLHSHGVAIQSCTEPIETTTPVGRFLWGNLANAAQLEKAIIKERTKMGMFSLARAGKWTRPFVPLGYSRTKGGYLKIKRSEVATVRRVFEAYPQEGSFAMCAQKLNEEGLSLRGKNWTAGRVRQLLENHLYRGIVASSGVAVTMPRLAIVSKEEFEACARVRTSSIRNGKPLGQSAKDEAIDAVFRQYLDSLKDLPEG